MLHLSLVHVIVMQEDIRPWSRGQISSQRCTKWSKGLVRTEPLCRERTKFPTALAPLSSIKPSTQRQDNTKGWEKHPAHCTLLMSRELTLLNPMPSALASWGRPRWFLDSIFGMAIWAFILANLPQLLPKLCCCKQCSTTLSFRVFFLVFMLVAKLANKSYPWEARWQFCHFTM